MNRKTWKRRLDYRNQFRRLSHKNELKKHPQEFSFISQNAYVLDRRKMGDRVGDSLWGFFLRSALGDLQFFPRPRERLKVKLFLGWTLKEKKMSMMRLTESFLQHIRERTEGDYVRDRVLSMNYLLASTPFIRKIASRQRCWKRYDVLVEANTALK